MGIPWQLNKEIAFLMLVLIEDYQSYKDRGSEQVASRRWKRERDGWWFRRHWQTARLIMDFNVDVTLFTKVLNDLQKKKKNLAYYRRPSDLGSNQSFWRSSFCRLPVSATFGKWSSQCVCVGWGGSQHVGVQQMISLSSLELLASGCLIFMVILCSCWPLISVISKDQHSI